MKNLLCLITIIILFGIFTNKVNAYVIDKTTDRVYEVKDDYLEITETRTINILESSWFIPSGNIEGFTIFFPLGKDPQKDNKQQATLSSIQINDSDGRTLSFNSENTANGNLILTATIPKDINFGSEYKITLKYNSYGLMLKSGNLRDIYIPAFSKDYTFLTDNYKETINTLIRIPKTFGNINFSSPQGNISEEGEFRNVRLSQEQLIGETGWIQVGTTQFYSFDIVQPYNKTSDIFFTQNEYRVIIPRDVSAGPVKQKIYFKEISPSPSHIEEDKDGNLIAVFNINSNTEGDIRISGFAEIEQDNAVDINNSGKVSDIPIEVINSNTSSAEFWESDSELIKQTAKEIIGGVDPKTLSVYEIAQKTYSYVVNKIDYSNVKRFGVNERKGALATLQGGAAVCMEYSDLFIALMRANGVPARAGFGFGYSALDDIFSSENAINHQWAEVYFPSIESWIAIDTTWGENGNELIGGDLNHFYTHVASISPNKPSTAEVQFYGVINDIPARESKVVAIDALPQNPGETESEIISKYKDTSTKNLFTSVNESIDDLVEGIFPNISTLGKSIIKVLGFVLIATILFFFIRFLSRKIKSLGKHRTSLYTK